MKIKKIAILGASQKYVHILLRDLIHTIRWKEGIFSIYDINPEPAETAGKYCEKIVLQNKSDIKIIYGTDPSLMLKNADIVVIIVGTETPEDIREEAALLNKHNLYYTLMDSYGLPMVRRLMKAFNNFQSIAETILKYSDKALIVNVSNPMVLITRLLKDKLSHQRVYGICNGILSLPNLFPDIDIRRIKIFGFNHCNFVESIETPVKKISGKDLKTVLTQSTLYKYTRKSLDHFGFPLLSKDNHAVEFFPEWNNQITIECPYYPEYWEMRWERYQKESKKFKEWAYELETIPEGNIPGNDVVIPSAFGLLEKVSYISAVNDINSSGLSFISPDSITEYMIDYADPEPFNSDCHYSEKLIKKIQEMDHFYSQIYSALLSKDVQKLIDNTAFIYRETSLNKHEIADLIKKQADRYFSG
jgi:alpha-galactosidase/6-phospho-beta-glucosidase family protein